MLLRAVKQVTYGVVCLKIKDMITIYQPQRPIFETLIYSKRLLFRQTQGHDQAEIILFAIGGVNHTG